MVAVPSSTVKWDLVGYDTGGKVAIRLTCVNDSTFVCYSSDYDRNEGNRPARHAPEKVVGKTCRSQG